MSDELSAIRQRFIEAAGHTTQSLGAGRVIGQIFAYLYFSREPRTLDDLTLALGISKGSASMAVRQLEQWGAVRKLWIKGDRKDYYEAMDELGRITRRVMLDSIGKRMDISDALIRDSEGLMEKAKKNGSDKEDWAFLDKRLRRFRQFKERAQWLWEKFFQGILLK